ncbi:MAG TPA: hypothetical protein VFW11_24710 [Cyclobacteriaceae bacterium]|nr:hypothetical protein [Cyclobacteriaceae bacterium]
MKKTGRNQQAVRAYKMNDPLECASSLPRMIRGNGSTKMMGLMSYFNISSFVNL